MRSLFSGVSGLRVHQTKMDVIANNVSNVNTLGFKRADVTFTDVFNQTLSSASGPNDASGRGGTNAMQIGLGSNVASINNIMTTGSTQRTDNGNDLMINGDGFFIVSDANGYSFTRAGAFQVDKLGNLNDANGMRVCGWPAIEDADNPGQQKIQPGKVVPINLYEGDKSYAPPKATTTIEFDGNINIEDSPKTNTMAFYDTLGNRYVVSTKLEYDETANPKTWTFSMENKAVVNGDEKNPVELTGLDVTKTLTFDANGKPIGTTEDLKLDLTGVAFAGEAPFTSEFTDPLTVNFANMTQFKGKTDLTSSPKDGNEAGSLKEYSIDSSGKITGKYTNGATKLLGQIPIADFKNPAGLEKIGSNLYQTSPNSGDFDGIGLDIGAVGGTFISGSLEMSNVDLSYEFTQMITTQRGFQANSRVITTSDDMLQELVNLKR